MHPEQVKGMHDPSCGRRRNGERLGGTSQQPDGADDAQIGS